MEKILDALQRNEKAKVARKKGFVPGVIYGKGVETVSVNFDKGSLIKVLKEKGEKAKIEFTLNGEKNYGIIKELSRDDATGEILHIDIQNVDTDENVKWSIPVIFEGKENLKNKGLYIQVYATEIEVDGEVGKIPDNIVLDAGKKQYGDELRFKDIKLAEGIRLLNDSDKLIAIITNA